MFAPYSARKRITGLAREAGVPTQLLYAAYRAIGIDASSYKIPAGAFAPDAIKAAVAKAVELRDIKVRALLRTKLGEVAKQAREICDSARKVLSSLKWEEQPAVLADVSAMLARWSVYDKRDGLCENI